mmetsp:Transcript_12460/g.25319  ORF Transcript_12460/g.25319 Transcript_12460/m.25319 type:complete len:215 (+) Transcript_12460:664-1308(+)
MYGKRMLTHPENHVLSPEPSSPPRLTIEFQNASSAPVEPARPTSYSATNLSSSGSSAAHHFSANSAEQRFITSASAWARRARQSSSEPSSVTLGKPHNVETSNEKKLFVASMTVMALARRSSAVVPPKAGCRSCMTPSTTFFPICAKKPSSGSLMTPVQSLGRPSLKLSRTTSSTFLPLCVTHFERSSSAFRLTCVAIACRIMSQKCWGRRASG